ncbi:Glutamate 5-kinase [Mycolicibacterium aubagnense]
MTAGPHPVSAHREAVRTARSVVVKIGTTALTAPNGMFDAGRLATLADAIEKRMKAGSDVVIVSSGAIAAGIEPLGLTKRPTDSGHQAGRGQRRPGSPGQRMELGLRPV